MKELATYSGAQHWAPNSPISSTKSLDIIRRIDRRREAARHRKSVFSGSQPRSYICERYLPTMARIFAAQNYLRTDASKLGSYMD